MNILLLLLTINSVVSKRAQGISYLGQGYNLITGNPLSTSGPDPGFTNRSFIKLQYTQGKQTPDAQQWDVPDNCEINPDASVCSTEFTTSTITGANSYKSSLDQSFKMGLRVFTARFSASREYNKVSASTNNHKNVYTTSKASCTVYDATTDHYSLTADDISDDFRTGLSELPTEYNSSTKNKYFELITYFGTHVLTGLNLGGHWGTTTEITEKAYTSMEQSGLSVG